MATFHPFSRLPLELRRMIWEAALLLPDFGPCVFPWRKGCWEHTTYSPEPDSNFDADGEPPTWVEYSVTNLGPLRVRLPVAHVNREAKEVAEDCVRRNKSTQYTWSQPRYSSYSHSPVVCRELNYQQDAVFVTTAQWDDFLAELDEVIKYGENMEVNMPLEHLIITKETFAKNWSDISAYEDIKKLSILHEDQAQVNDEAWWKQTCGTGPVQQHWCELHIPLPETVASCTDSGWEIFIGEDEDGSDGERERFEEMTCDVFGHLGDFVIGSSISDRKLDVFMGVRLLVKSA
ncbi:hypothetical protein B0T14DRAFT_499099 [Immersiella caudata]|uniref:2EXR domain-containing protein n=1 Tax=Immersiella caudata TaxID=314043 RepID=A0AA40BU25_9PEZI|nr:hypothetical protein B0T14DRAFT_499099 [Immersiella caudata]